jgi:hypothetical protein
MDRKQPKLKGLSDSRFGSMIFLLRMAGIPLKVNKMFTIYAIYMVTVTICTCSTLIGMSVDVYIHRGDLVIATTTMPVLISFMNVMWVFSTCR